MAGTLSVAVALVSVGCGVAEKATSASDSPTAATIAGSPPPRSVGSPVTTVAGASSGVSRSTRPATPHQAVPSDLVPSLAGAAADNPVIYADGCHLGFLESKPGSCVYGNASSATTVVLFGDSHAGQWFPALDALANAEHFRLVSLTKSACSAADARVWNSSLQRPYTECDTWRSNVFARIAAEHPALVVIAEDSAYQVVVNGSPVPVAQQMGMWNAGLLRTLVRLHATAGAVALIGETPRSAVDPPVCLSAHLTDALACATPLTAAINPAWMASEKAVATAADARYVDSTPLVCPSDPCPSIIGHVLVYRDQHHLTAAFSTVLARRLGIALQLPPG